jgi:hypothetical protein
MRDLKRAAKEGPHQFIVSVSHLPRRHPLAIAGFCGSLALVLVFLGVYETHQEINMLRPQITNVQRGDPCVQLSQANGSNEVRVHRLTERCIVFLNGIAPLVSTKLACAIVEKGGYVCRALKSEEVVPSTGNSPHSHPGPSGGHAGHHGNSGQKHQLLPPSEPLAPAPPVSESPGNSGETPGATHGVKACVEVVTSACIKAETPELPSLHP